MTTISLPSPELLRKLLRYEPDTGKLFWRERTPDMFAETGIGGSEGACNRWNGRFANREAFTAIGSHGYHFGTLFGKGGVTTHRVVWAIKQGVWPNCIDHINGVKTDNRWKNLRDVTRQENCKNMALRSDNTSGAVGVSWSSKDKRWIAQIWHQKTKKHLGQFKEKSSAIAARKKAEREYEYHENHGRN